MQYIRRLDLDDPKTLRPNGHHSQLLFGGESCTIIGTRVPSGRAGFAHHIHRSDQLYYVLKGETNIQFGSTVEVVREGTAAFIPGGLAHHNWNPSDADEVHLEVIAPGTYPGRPLAERREPGEDEDGPYFLRPRDEAKYASPDKSSDWLVTREQGSPHATLRIANIPPSGGGPKLHVHDFDQFFFVLEGVLTVQVALETHTAGPGHLVVLPAGVPHRQWNGGAAPERHLAILTPSPELPNTPQTPWDVLVSLEVIEH